MDNTNKDQKVTEAMKLVDQLIQKEKEKNAEQLERLYKLDSAVILLACNIREAAYFIRPLITEAAWYNANSDTEDIQKLLDALPMINKIFDNLIAEAEKAEEI